MFSNTQRTYHKLNKLFTKLRQRGVTLKLEKCKCLTNETKFIGYVINRQRIKPDLAKIVALLKFPEPKNLKYLQRILGAANYCRKFYENYSSYTAKFKRQLRKNNKFVWDRAASDAFKEFKENVLKTVILQHLISQNLFT